MTQPRVPRSPGPAAAHENVAGQIRSHGGRADFVPADLRDAASAKGLARRVTEVAGRIDILVNTAGIAVFGPTAAASEADFDAVRRVEEAERSTR